MRSKVRADDQTSRVIRAIGAELQNLSRNAGGAEASRVDRQRLGLPSPNQLWMNRATKGETSLDEDAASQTQLQM
jgi:hypothetical protein